MRRSRIPTHRTARTWAGTDAKVVRHVHVCGVGQLATATRIELVRLGIHRDSDCQLPSLHPPLVIACGDSEADESFDEGAAHAFDIGSPLLLACLSGRLVRIGPLIQPPDDGPAGPIQVAQYLHPAGIAEAQAEPGLSLYARLGALLIAAQALNFLLGTRHPCVLNQVIELNPWSMESRSYKVLKVRQ